MARTRALTDEKERELVQAYLESDETIADLTERFKIARQTLYDILDRHDVERDRNPPTNFPEGCKNLSQAYAWAMKRVLAQEKEMGRLEEQLKRKDEVIEGLVDRLRGE